MHIQFCSKAARKWGSLLLHLSAAIVLVGSFVAVSGCNRPKASVEKAVKAENDPT